MGASPPSPDMGERMPGEPNTTDASASDDVKDGAGFPAGTPVAEMTVEQQVAYWKQQARKHENRVKSYADYDELKAKAQQFAALEAASRTEHENALLAAKEEARAEALRQATPRLVAAEFRVAAAGRVDADRLAAILEPLDLSKFLTDKGEVDADKVTTYVDGIAPKTDEKQRRFPDLGQGRRSGAQPTGAAAGLAEAQRRFGVAQ